MKIPASPLLIASLALTSTTLAAPTAIKRDNAPSPNPDNDAFDSPTPRSMVSDAERRDNRHGDGQTDKRRSVFLGHKQRSPIKGHRRAVSLNAKRQLPTDAVAGVLGGNPLSTVGGVVGGLSDTATGLVGGLLPGQVGGVVNGITQPLVGGLVGGRQSGNPLGVAHGALAGVGGAVGGITHSISGLLPGQVGGIVNGVTDPLVDGLTSGRPVSGVVGTVNGLLGTVGGLLPGGLGNTVTGITNPLLSNVAGTVDGVIGQNGPLQPVIGHGGVVEGLLGGGGGVFAAAPGTANTAAAAAQGGLLGSGGLVGGVLSNDGLVGGVLGQNGLVGGLLGGGSNGGLLGGLTGGANGGLLGGLTGGLLGGDANGGLLGGVTGGLLGGGANGGLLGGVTGGLLGGGGNGGLLGGLLGGGAGGAPASPASFAAAPPAGNVQTAAAQTDAVVALIQKQGGVVRDLGNGRFLTQAGGVVSLPATLAGQLRQLLASATAQTQNQGTFAAQAADTSAPADTIQAVVGGAPQFAAQAIASVSSAAPNVPAALDDTVTSGKVPPSAAALELAKSIRQKGQALSDADVLAALQSASGNLSTNLISLGEGMDNLDLGPIEKLLLGANGINLIPTSSAPASIANSASSAPVSPSSAASAIPTSLAAAPSGTVSILSAAPPVPLPSAPSVLLDNVPLDEDEYDDGSDYEYETDDEGDGSDVEVDGEIHGDDVGIEEYPNFYSGDNEIYAQAVNVAGTGAALPSSGSAILADGMPQPTGSPTGLPTGSSPISAVMIPQNSAGLA